MKHYQQWQKNNNHLAVENPDVIQALAGSTLPNEPANVRTTYGSLGSSETIRETSIGPRRAMPLPEGGGHINDIWWFIGFVEGAGSFLVSTTKGGRTQVFFIINQKDPKVLWKIRDILGIGKISQYDTYYRYVLTKNDHILFLINILNGRLILKKTNKRFNNWLKVEKYSHIPRGKSDYESYTLSNAWLSGFIEAEGCFNARVTRPKAASDNSLRIRLRFIIDQKNESDLLLRIKESFNCGFIETTPLRPFRVAGGQRAEKEMKRFVLDANKRQSRIIDYLETYPLKGDKKVSYIKFKRLWNKLELKQHLNITSSKVRKRLLNLVETINSREDHHGKR